MLTRRTILAGGLAGLALGSPARAQGVVRLPLTVTGGGLAVVDADIRGGRLRFVVDTGAEVSAIRRDLAGPLGLTRAGHRAGTGADGHLRLTDYEATDVVFGGRLRVPRMSLAAIPGLKIYDGLLAARFLTTWPSELDYGAREIRLYPGGQLDMEPYATVGARRAAASRFYCPFALDGLALSGLIDTGFETGIFLNAGLVARHDLWRRFPVREEKAFTGAAGRRMVMRVVDMPAFRLGDVEWPSIEVTLADPATGGIGAIGPDEGVIGAALLRHFAIAFDGADGLGLRLAA